MDQPLWKDLITESPDLFIWAGDNIYANTNNPLEIQEGYRKQNTIPDYILFKTLTPIIGTWDDHDYANNDANGQLPFKKDSQTYFLDFMDEPLNSPRRKQPGIYTSYEIGQRNQKVKIILLDNRYFKDLDKNLPLLGKTQWTWLEKEIRQSTASLNFIVSGVSITSPQMLGSEEWADYPTEQNRLFELLKIAKTKGVVFLSGDKHFSSIFARQGHIEFMSSGMTHNTRLPLRPIVRRTFPNSYFEFNYGMIDIQWEGLNPLISMSIRNAKGHKALVRNYQWNVNSWKEI